jgi:ribonuclease BN (tRNA processing enzyme)
MDANVKQLYLFHVEPNYDDTKMEELHRHTVKLIHERQSNLECHIAREGLIIDIDRL